MQVRTLMALLMAASLGAVVTGCQQRSDDGTAQPQSRADTPMMQGKAPGAPTQSSDAAPGAQQGSSSTADKGGSSTATAPQAPDKGANAMASPSDDRTKSDESAKQKGSS
jgi:hypothetical protein